MPGSGSNARLEEKGRTLPRPWIEATLPRTRAIVIAAGGNLAGAIKALDSHDPNAAARLPLELSLGLEDAAMPEVADEALGHQLLVALRGVFKENEDRLFSKDICRRLNEDDPAPFQALRDGRGLDARGLANRLRPYGIHPRTVRLSEGPVWRSPSSSSPPPQSPALHGS